MALTKNIIKGVTAEQLAELRKAGTPFQQNYFPDPKYTGLEVKSYECFELPSNFDGKWIWIRFLMNEDKTPLEFQVKGNRVLDPKKVPKIRVLKFVCKKAFTAPNGTVVPQGKVKYMAVKA